jgi:hypothetical protein
MAIPVSNPPPREEPPPSKSTASAETPDALGIGGGPGDDAMREPSLQGGAPSAMSPMARGCIMALGLAGVLVCIASLGLAVSCRGLLQAGESEGARRIAVSYRAASVAAGQETAYASDLAALESLGTSGQLSLMAFAILNNRYNEAMGNDGVIDADELHHGMELVHDIVLGQGSVDVQRYPDAR